MSLAPIYMNERCTSLLSPPPRLQNDLYCVEWDVKLYYTIPYNVHIRIFMKISLHENVGRVGADLRLQRVHMSLVMSSHAQRNMENGDGQSITSLHKWDQCLEWHDICGFNVNDCTSKTCYCHATVWKTCSLCDLFMGIIVCSLSQLVLGTCRGKLNSAKRHNVQKAGILLSCQCCVAIFVVIYWFICLFFFYFLGSRTIVHPKARIIAEAGPIIIGDGNLIEERCEIINRWVIHCHPESFCIMYHLHPFTWAKEGVFYLVCVWLSPSRITQAVDRFWSVFWRDD